MSQPESPDERLRAQSERQKKRRETSAAYLFQAPYLALLCMFGLFPVIYAFGLSFFDTIEGVFWGLTNYTSVLSDFRLPRSTVNVLTFTAIWVALTVVGVTVLSLMLDVLPRRLATMLRTIFFLPGAVISSALVVLWLFLLDPSVSPFRPILHLVGWETLQSLVVGLGYATVFAIMSYFATSGGWIVVMGGALASLPTEVIEAARVDGAKPYQIAARIKLPMIWRSIVLMAILSLAAGIQIFVEPQLISLAGAQFAQPDWSLNQLAFSYAFQMGDFGASAALSTMLVLVSVTIALVIIFVTKFYKID